MKETLAKHDWHHAWEKSHLTEENFRFFERTFDFMCRELEAPENALIFDAGCGNGVIAMRLAQRGFRVLGIDFSDVILEEARARFKDSALKDRVKFRRENLTDLGLEDGSFDYVLCQGVLMHIPEIRRAIAELARVTAPGGRIVICENNMQSVQSRVTRLLAKVRKSAFVDHCEMAEDGMQVWTRAYGDLLLVRDTSIPWLIHAFAQEGCSLRRRIARQFTEHYVKFSNPLIIWMIHRFNKAWFRYVRLPGPAFGNIIIFEKRDGGRGDTALPT